MSSLLYDLLNTPSADLDLRGEAGERVLADLREWVFGAEENASRRANTKPLTFLQAFFRTLPPWLNGHDAMSEVAKRLLQLAVEHGEDPRVGAEEPLNRFLEDRGPEGLRKFLVNLRGGNVQFERERQALEAHQKEDLPAQSLRHRLEREGKKPVLLGAPLPIGLFLGHEKWISRHQQHSDFESAMARTRAAHVFELLEWAWDGQDSDDRWAATSVAWCVVEGQKKGSLTSSTRDAWRAAGEALEARCAELEELAGGFERVRLARGALSALDGRYGALTPDVAILLANGLASESAAAVAWGRSIEVAATTIPLQRETLSQWQIYVAKGFLPRYANMALCRRSHRCGPPAKGTEDEAVWLTAWPLPVAVRAWGVALASLSDTCQESDVERWWELADRWLARHPEQADAFFVQVAAHQLPQGTRWNVVARASAAMARSRSHVLDAAFSDVDWKRGPAHRL